MSFECTVSSDCLTARNDSIVRFCFEQASFSDEVFFCDCEVWFGWQGNDCNQTSTALSYNRAAKIILSVWAFIIMILIGRTCILNLLVGFNPKQGKDTIIYTGVYSFLSAACLFINLVLRLPSFYDPSNFEVDRPRFKVEGENVISEQTNTANFFIHLTVVFQIFAILYMMLSWQSLIIKIKRFQSQGKVNYASKWRFRLKIFASLFLIAIILLLSLNLPEISLAVIMIFAITSAIGFLIYSFKFVKTVENFQINGHKTLILIVKLVKKVCFWSCVCLLSLSLILIIYVPLSRNIDRKIAPGEFNYALFLRDLTILVVLCFLTLLGWYVNSVTEGALVAELCPICCYSFECWDNKNSNLMPGSRDKSSSSTIPGNLSI